MASPLLCAPARDVGSIRDAKEETQRTLSFDPLSVPGNSNLGILIAREGKFAQARAQFDRALQLGGNYVVALYYLGALEAAHGNYQRAADLLQRARAVGADFTGVRGALAFSYQHLGRTAESSELLSAAKVRLTDQRAPAYERSRTDYALALAMMGQSDSAFSMLQGAQWDIPTLIDLRADPLLQGFRSDPRYPGLLRRFGLKP